MGMMVAMVKLFRSTLFGNRCETKHCLSLQVLSIYDVDLTSSEKCRNAAAYGMKECEEKLTLFSSITRHPFIHLVSVIYTVIDLTSLIKATPT
jgi:hypothetical protein